MSIGLKQLSWIGIIGLILMGPACKKAPPLEGKYNIEIKEYQVELLSIELKSFSFSSSAYSFGDIGSPPDVYFVVTQLDNEDQFTHSYSQVFNNMNVADLPHTFEFSPALKLVGSISLADEDLGKTFGDLITVNLSGISSVNPITIYDFDGGPSGYPESDGFGQRLAEFYSPFFIFDVGVHNVTSEKGDAFLTYQISEK